MWGAVRDFAAPLAISLLAVALVVSAYGRLSFAYDEPAHLATGIEFLDRGEYEYEHQHPPLSRIVAATGPYLLGVRSIGEPSMWSEGRALLFDSGRPVETVLTAARAGLLLFLVLGIFLTWHIGSVLWSPESGALAALLLALQPVFLGHAALATTDAPAAVTLMLAIWLLLRLLETPSMATAAFAGAAVAVAVTTKFTALFFLSAAVVVLILAALLRNGLWQRLRSVERPVREGMRLVGAFVAAAFFVAWAVYGFSTGPLLAPENAPFEGIDALLGASGPLHDLAYFVATAPLPMPELAGGLLEAWTHGAQGHRSYFLGEVSWSGWPLFFPTALALKTPIAFLLLVCAGYVASLRAGRTVDWRVLAILAVPPALVVSVLNAPFNIGVRHVLGVYPFLAVIAAAGAVAIARRWRIAGTAVAGLLVVWQAVAVIRAYPDYMAYFSEPFESAPQEYLIDSDLVWGQDLVRLREYLNAESVDSVHVSIMGMTPARRLEQYGLPAVSWLEPYQPVAGWVVVDWYTLLVGSNTDLTVPADANRWLLDHEPEARLGAGTLVYRFEGAPTLSAHAARRRAEWLASGATFRTAEDVAEAAGR